jgi:hypothetical protein
MVWMADFSQNIPGMQRFAVNTWHQSEKRSGFWKNRLIFFDENRGRYRNTVIIFLFEK